MMNFNLSEHTIFRCLSGSRAYGTNTPESDEDFRGVAIPPKEYFLGFLHRFEQAESKPGENHDQPDEMIYGIQKFTSLATKNNPNVLELLFMPEDAILKTTPSWERLIGIRDSFLSTQVKDTYTGYAIAQLKRIKLHRQWLLNPPKHQPTRAEFGLPDNQDLAAFKAKVELANKSGYDAMAMFGEEIQKEAQYKSALNNWNSYLNWQKTRNPARAELEAKFGYDCYTEDTEFLTNGGWKKYDQINETDLLGTVFLRDRHPDYEMGHRKNMGLEFQSFIDRFEGTFTGHLYHLYGNHLDTLVTPNHRMLFERTERASGKKFGWVLEEAAALPDTFSVLTGITPTAKNFKLPDKIKGLPILPHTLMLLMGWFLSEGSIGFRKNKKDTKPKNISITQKKGGRLHNSMEIFQRLHGEAAHSSLYIYQRKPDKYRVHPMDYVLLSIREKTLVQFLTDECGHSKEKHIPEWVFSLSKRLLDILLGSLLGGDGTVRNTSFHSDIYYSSVKQLADDVQRLAFTCGYETSLYGPYSYDPPHHEPMYQVHINKEAPKTRTLIRSQNIERILVKDQRIVCFTVPNGTLVTRRNGHIGIHGNSKHAAHLVRLLRTGYEILMTGKVHVRRPDAEELLAIRREGIWPYEKLEAYAEDMDKELTRIYDENLSPLPKHPNLELIDAVMVEIVSDFLGLR